jgi:hypothetical protein
LNGLSKAAISYAASWKVGLDFVAIEWYKDELRLTGVELSTSSDMPLGFGRGLVGCTNRPFGDHYRAFFGPMKRAVRLQNNAFLA